MEAAPSTTPSRPRSRRKLEADYPGETMRFRTSTNSEDLDGFPCAGCYESQTGDPADWDDVLERDPRRPGRASGSFRTFEERSYYGIDHQERGHGAARAPQLPGRRSQRRGDHEQPVRPSGLEPAFYVNVQWGGDAEVVAPAGWRDERPVPLLLRQPEPADHVHQPTRTWYPRARPC